MSEADYSDEDLTAYLDGEANAELHAAIAAALTEDAALRRRLSALELPLEKIRTGMARLTDLAPPAPLFPRQRRNQLPMIAALIAGLAIGGGSVHFLSPPAPDREWQDYAAAYHVLYQTATLDGVTPQADFSLVSDVIGLDLQSFAEASEITFLRAQVLGYQGAPIIQMAYLDPDGTPHALCISRATGPETPVTGSRLEGLAAADWSDGRHEFLLIGGPDTVGLEDQAAYFQSLMF
ncbi:MAG: hypothetical protein AAGF88_04450 [Pseudomonadota bacterium]